MSGSLTATPHVDAPQVEGKRWRLPKPRLALHSPTASPQTAILGYAVRCPQCDLALTLHQPGNRGICHGCGHVARVPLHDLHRLQIFDYADAGPERGWKSVHVTDGDHPYMGKWWVPGLAIGYEHSFVHQVADFLEAYAAKKPCPPTFRDALETQKVCDAVLQSATSRRWVNVDGKPVA